VSALPYSNPNIPALIGAGLAGDLPQQLARGQRDVASAIGRAPVAGMLHPPGSHLDQRSLYELQGNGVHTLLVDSGTVDQPTTPLGFAEPPVAALSVGTTAPVDAIVPNDGVESLLQSALPRLDPHLAAQQVLGELASIWLERPSVSRGVAVTVSEHTGLPGYFFGPFVHAIQTAPWLHPITASAMVRVQPPRHHLAGLAGLPGPTFSPTYLGDLQAARQAITTYRSIASEKTLPAALDQMVLIAESGQFATQENLGEQFLHAVTDRLDAEFKGVSPDTSALETLTSRSGTIIVPIHNLTGHPVKVRVALDGGVRLAVSNNSQVVPVPVGGTTLRFGVQARTTGRFPVQVTISTPDGHITLSQGRLVVRSTAYNRIALVLTIGAALFLLALWARRALPWTKR
jgi:hypothetical protein